MNKTLIHVADAPNSRADSAAQAPYIGKLALTIDEAADCTGIGRNTLRKLVAMEKIPVLRIGRKTIIRTDVIISFMELNQGRDLLDYAQVQQVY